MLFTKKREWTHRYIFITQPKIKEQFVAMKGIVKSFTVIYLMIYLHLCKEASVNYFATPAIVRYKLEIADFSIISLFIFGI